LNGPPGSGLGLADFMRLKGFQPFGLVHALGLVENSTASPSNAIRSSLG
jgi:hypothetical protein